MSMFYSIIRNDVTSRDYSDFTVVYDLRNSQILQLESVSADIWNYIYEHCSADIKSITNHIVSIYECSEEEIHEDIVSFLNELYISGLIQIDNSYCSSNDSSPKPDSTNTNDVEGQIIESLAQNNQQYSATIEMTYSCNEKCVHCYAHFLNSNNEASLSLEAYKSFIDQLYENKVFHIAFTGGDPFMNPLFPEVFAYSREKGFVCDVFTNGLCLANNDKSLESFVSLRPRAFFISLYGASPEVHDSITRIPGSFEKTVQTISTLHTKGIAVILNIMILKTNYSDYQNIIDLANKLGVEYRVSMSLIYRNDKDSSPMDYFIGNKENAKTIIKSINKLYSIDKPIAKTDADTQYICGAGVSSICLSPDGTIYPCVSLKTPLGNILHNTLNEIWNGENRSRLLSELKWENTKKCNDCKFQSICPHCPAMSQAENNDFLECNTCDRFIAECIFETRS